MNSLVVHYVYSKEREGETKMSSLYQDAVDAHESTARWIDNFLWESKPYKSEPKEHTKEEYREFLLKVAEGSWRDFDETKGNFYD